MEVRLYTGQLKGRDAHFLVTAADATDAGRYVAATLGDPATVVEVPRAEGVCIELRHETGRWSATRAIPNLATEASLAPETMP